MHPHINSPSPVNGENDTFAPPFLPYKSSQPVPRQFLKGYFSKIEPRLHCCAEKEDQLVTALTNEWYKRGGCPLRGLTLSPAGGFLSLTFPEADPERLAKTSANIALAFIEDDFLDGDLVPYSSGAGSKELSLTADKNWKFKARAYMGRYKLTPKKHKKVPSDLKLDEIENYEFNKKDYGIIIDQLKAKSYIEMLDDDPDNNVVAYIQSYEDWVARTVETSNLELRDQDEEYRDLDEYLTERLTSVGAESYLVMMPYCHKIKMTIAQYDAVNDINQVAYRLCTLINDYYSAEKEWMVHAMFNKPALPISSVFIAMRTHNVSMGEAKDIVKKKYAELETEYLQLRQEFLDKLPSLSPELVVYLSNLELIVSGLMVYSMNAPRYKVDSEKPFYPKPEHKIKDLPRKRSEAPKTPEKEPSVSFLNTSPTSSESTLIEKPSSPTINKPKKIPNGITDNPWIASYSKLPEEVVLEPYEYIKSMPSKKIRNTAIKALEVWYKVSDRSLEIITSVVDMLHSSSLIIDDIEDNSTLRRGQPAAHMVYGTPQSINAANYLFIKCLEEVNKLSPAAIGIYIDELRNLHVGQGQDLHRSFHTECPSEKEYIQTIDGKTGGLFRMACRLMRAEARQNKDLDVEELLTLMGRFFQVRDDYQNLESAEYSAAKGDLSDLDEGKYSLIIIHALNSAKGSQLKSLLQMRSRQGSMTPEQKSLVMRHIKQSKSMEYTRRVLGDLQREIDVKLARIEKSTGGEENWMVRAIMARLRVADPTMPYLRK